MRSLYRAKRPSACGSCKPWQKGWSHRFKQREVVLLREFAQTRKYITGR